MPARKLTFILIIMLSGAAILSGCSSQGEDVKPDPKPAVDEKVTAPNPETTSNISAPMPPPKNSTSPSQIVVVAAAYPIVDTNQTKCYDNFKEIPCPEPGEPFYGQDAQFTVNPPEYADNGDGTVTDKATGLMWVKDDSGYCMNWKEALEYVQKMNEQGYLGYSDWRLPNAKELQSIVDYTRSSDASDPSKRGVAIEPIFTVTSIINVGAMFPAIRTLVARRGML
ncbi:MULTISPECIES: DUF1566 domain-containing protein [Archaeoglobus]|jgi:hypothetical protein|uniref:Lcl C-terminal domain-containing protein n=1 Tax=Archaeoglobus fulgidus TaxID=2234 RepID=A0A101DF97_ARCFL|nr:MULTISPECIES: DUF1566 domain-containing protein [Archaeoglobus]KUJ94418.1 MAG: hypothetical protein XD40_0354 [Archaeoglobus fulgidus]KUK07388.1 MAG: Uncharacterized protein XD48_0384 [Archaeoglobus fulgidus]MDI3496675.1 hypothetical protein [Archaeoglobus sp.]